MLPDIEGLEILKHVSENSPETMVIMIKGYASMDTSIKAMKNGAFSYITKPFEVSELLVTAKKALEKQSLALENKRLLNELKKANEELEEANLSLEQKVIERTKELQILNEDLKNANLELTRLGKLKDELISLVSHDLKSPLTAIIGYCSSLQYRSISDIGEEKARDYIDRISGQAFRMLGLIDDILDEQKLKDGKMTLNADLFDLGKISRECYEEMKILASEKKAGLYL